MCAFDSFETTAAAVVAFLREHLTLETWLVTRIVDDEWIVLHAFGDGPLRAGDVLQFGQTICRQMVAGRGPNTAPELRRVPSYASVRLPADVADIEAYAGAPILTRDGELFGTLCACDPAPQHEELIQERSLLLLQARLLGTVLAQELDEDRLRRRAERAEYDALVDPLTGLVNRRGWEKAIVSEEQRGLRYGHPASIFILDLDGLKRINDASGHDAGDRLLCRTAEILKGVCRESDIVARLGGDEFGILLVESDAQAGAATHTRLMRNLSDAGIAASIGSAQRRAATGLHAACNEADRAMYRHKGRPLERT